MDLGQIAGRNPLGVHGEYRSSDNGYEHQCRSHLLRGAPPIRHRPTDRSRVRNCYSRYKIPGTATYTLRSLSGSIMLIARGGRHMTRATRKLLAFVGNLIIGLSFVASFANGLIFGAVVNRYL
jgi:hypothetical protein